MNLQQNKTEEFIKILGAYGSRFENLATTCVQICDTVLIDAGNVMKPLGKKVEYIQVKDQNHLIMKYSRRILWTKSIIAWFDKWLKNQPEWWENMYPEK